MQTFLHHLSAPLRAMKKKRILSCFYLMRLVICFLSKKTMKSFLKSFIQAKPELVNLSGENPEKTLFLFPVFQNEKNGKSENSLTFYGNDIIYLTTKKFFETAVEACM